MLSSSFSSFPGETVFSSVLAIFCRHMKKSFALLSLIWYFLTSETVSSILVLSMASSSSFLSSLSLSLTISLLTVDLIKDFGSFLSSATFSSFTSKVRSSFSILSIFLFLLSPARKTPFLTAISLRLLAPNSSLLFRRLSNPSFEIDTASVTWRLRAPRWDEVRVTFQSSTPSLPPCASLE